MKNIAYLLLVILVFISCKKEVQKENPEIIVSEKVTPKFEFGFNLDEFVVVSDTVRSGDSFGKILFENHIGYGKIEELAKEGKDTFDVKRLQIGKKYTVLKSKDSLEKAQVFIYQSNRIEYTVFDFSNDSISRIYNAKKPVKLVEKEASGIITSTLSEAMDKAGLNVYLGYQLSDIYAWSIDFFRLQKGDKYKVIYTERYINDSIYAGIKDIKAATFEHKGTPFYAFEYEHDSIPEINDYYDEKGNTLRSQFLKAPVKFQYRISSRYNLRRRIKLYGNKIRPHKGTDFAAPVGTPIISTANGIVTESTRRGGNGKYVKIRHNSTYSTQYLHMSRRAVKVGDVVKQGDIIGYIGMTGNTSGPHVCYRFWKNGRQVDPLREKLPAAKPIKAELKAEYLLYIQPLKKQLDKIQYPQEPIL